MVVRRAIHHMRQRPDEDKHAVASSIAFSVVGLMLLIWGIFFFRKIQSTPVLPSLPASEEVFGVKEQVSVGSQQPTVPPTTYLSIASTTLTEEVFPQFPETQGSAAYDDMLRQEEAAMKALRGDIVLPGEASSTNF